MQREKEAEENNSFLG